MQACTDQYHVWYLNVKHVSIKLTYPHILEMPCNGLDQRTAGTKVVDSRRGS